jgi:hypothetical protein
MVPRAVRGIAAWPATMIVWGPGFTSTLHRHHCVQLLMTLRGSLLVRSGRRKAWRKCGAAWVRPGALMSIEGIRAHPDEHLVRTRLRNRVFLRHETRKSSARLGVIACHRRAGHSDLAVRLRARREPSRTLCHAPPLRKAPLGRRHVVPLHRPRARMPTSECAPQRLRRGPRRISPASA